MANSRLAERDRSATTSTTIARVAPGHGAPQPSLAKTFIRRALGALVPHYDRGAYGWERLDGKGYGEGRCFEIEWFGLKVSFAVGRRPRKDPVS